jgi:hypothetical protein
MYPFQLNLNDFLKEEPALEFLRHSFAAELITAAFHRANAVLSPKVSSVLKVPLTDSEAYEVETWMHS